MNKFQARNPEQEKSLKEKFLESLNNELNAMIRSGRITPEQTEKKNLFGGFRRIKNIKR